MSHMQNDGIIEEIKSRLDIVEVISEYVSLKRNGTRWKGLCPFHGEKTPSFIVSPDRQMFHCFGCHTGGDMISFVMKKEGLSFPDAIEMLARRAGVEIKRPNQNPEAQGVQDALYAMQKEAMAFFSEGLRASPDAMAYLKRREISDETIARFSLGYAPQGWHGLLDRLRRKKFNLPHILQSGLVVAGDKGTYDMFRQRVMFPIMSLRGEPIAFGGRVLNGGEPKYLNSPETPIFRKSETLYALNFAKEEIRRADKVVVVEGYMDAIACHQAGIKNVVAPLGTALTSGHAERLRRLAETLVLLFDGDKAGVAAARRSLGLALESGFKVRVLLLPDGNDPDGIIRSHGAEHLTEMLEAASTPVGFLVDTSGKRGSDAAKEAFEVLGKVTDALLRDDLIHELAERTGTREQSIREELKKMKRAGPAHTEHAQRPVAPQKKPHTMPDEEYQLLAVALTAPQMLEKILAELSVEEFQDSMARDILSKLTGLSEGQDLMAHALSGPESEETRAFVSRLIMDSGMDDAEDIEKIVSDCTRKMLTRRTDAEIRLIEQGIRKAAADNDTQALDGLLRRRQQLSAVRKELYTEKVDA